MIPSRWVLPAAGAVFFTLAGMLAGWALWRPKPTPPETYARESRQKDGSMVLERKPQADARPAQELPKGAKLERVVQVTVQPRALEPMPSPTAGPETPTSGSAEHLTQPDKLSPCPPVRLDLSLVRMPDRSRRVVASSPDGEVVAGLDVPVEAPEPQARALRWAAGGLYGVTSGGGRSIGAFVHRDAGPFRLGAEVTRDTLPAAPGQWSARALVGLRF